MTFSPQDRVALNSPDNEEIPFPRGAFVGYINRNTAAVMFDQSGLEEIPVLELIPESDAPEFERKAREQASKLEQDFEAVREQVSAQMRVAASALREATRLAGNVANSSLQEFYDECRPFLRAMDDAGWSTSSLNC